MVTVVLVILVFLPVALISAMAGFLVHIEHTFLATGANAKQFFFLPKSGYCKNAIIPTYQTFHL
jgi:hypothetical protein